MSKEKAPIPATGIDIHRAVKFLLGFSAGIYTEQEVRNMKWTGGNTYDETSCDRIMAMVIEKGGKLKEKVTLS